METFNEKTKNMKDVICLKIEDLMDAYKNASDEQKELLKHLFGTEVFKPKDVRERIKTFEDACHELGKEHPLVTQYKQVSAAYKGDEDIEDLVAYLKLRIIAAALNEGWEPQFVPGEYRWAPYFLLYTQEEIDKMDEETKARVVYWSDGSANAGGGVSYASSGSDSAYVDAYFGSRLAFKSEELSRYAGTQFIDIFADFML